MDKDPESAISSFLKGTEDQTVSFDLPESSFEQTEEQEVTEEKEEKALPFHKDPKIQKFLDKREKEIEERLKSQFKTSISTNQAQDDFKDVIDSFTSIIGNDTPEKVNAINALSKSLNGLDEKAVRRAEEKIEEIKQRELKADQDAENELENHISEIEETFGVDLTSRNSSKTKEEFLTFVEKIAPKKNGEIIAYPDMNSAWETFSESKKRTTPSRAKEIAARGMTRPSETAPKTPERVDWNKVDELMDELK